MMWKQRGLYVGSAEVVGATPGQDYVAPAMALEDGDVVMDIQAAAPGEPAADGGLRPGIRTALAIALHERWHGQHTPPGGKEACARRAGAYDDVDAIEPLILQLMRGEIA